ncbi:transposon Tf2-6 polyprotein [Trichonephila clavipes]|nr:transposon Tf2-6 polyprotein [Trichonephila clavipes]
MNYYNANNEDNINVKNNKGLDQISDSPEADLKRLFNPAMVVEDTVPKQTSEQWGDLTQLLDKFQTIFSQNKYDVGCISLEPQRIHLISDLPISLRPYRNSQQESKEIQTQIEELLKAGFIRPTHSPYAAPVTLAYKKDEGKRSRLCIDYRKLNEITRKDSTPVPLIDFVIDNLTHAKFFSTLDLTSGYWHIKIHEKDAEKLAFTTNFGLYEWLRLPFGWKNSPAVFQRTIRQILQKYQLTFALNYFDDIIIFSQSWEEHLTHLDTIFQICKKENIKLKKSKCQFAQEKIKFLGYEITQGHYSPSNPNIETIRKLAPPKDVKELQRFLGSINVYQKFIKDYAKLRVPLNKLLKKDAIWNWTHECQEAYQKLKNCLISKPILKLYNSQYPCHVFCDASQESIGVVLKQQHPDGTLYPIAYHSRQLLKHEKNYTISEKECLAIIDALDKFHCYLHGSKFTIHTDHAALQWLKSVKHLTGRLFRWSLKFSQYEYSIVYIKGKLNVEADMLSRNPVCHYISPICHFLNTDEIIKYQNSENINDPKYIKINDVLTVKKKNLIKIVVPLSLREKLIKTAHEQFGHPGVKKMLKLISPIYYWKDIILDISNFVKCCETCQMNKKSTQKKYGLLQEVPVAEEPFEMISLDTVGGFNYHNSQKKYLHIVLDHATRYAWTFPSKSVTSETYTNCLKQIFSIQCPKQLLSDRNAAFTSSKFKKFLKHHNIRQLLTSANRPQCNGKNERVNQTLVAKLRCKVNSTTKTPWTKLLEQITYEYNNSPHDVTGFPPAYLMFGTLPYDSPLPNQVKLNYPPIQQARQIAVNRTIKHHKINKQRYDKHYVDAKFKVGDLVLYQNFSYPNSSKLQSPYNGPFKVVRKLSNVTYEIDKPNQYTGKLTDIVHSTRLKPFHSKCNFQLC